MSERLGFIGLGNMGAPFATRLLSAGRELQVFDLRPEARQALISRGAIACDSPEAVASAAEIVFMSLPTPVFTGSVC